MKPSIIAPLLWLFKLASADAVCDSDCHRKIQVVIERFYKKAGTSIVDLENELSIWPRQCAALGPDTIQRAISLQQEIIKMTDKATKDAKCATAYTLEDLKKKIDWIPLLTISFISAMKGWDNAHEIVKAAGQEQAVLYRLRELKEKTVKFRDTVELALSSIPLRALPAYKEVWNQDHLTQQVSLDRTIQVYGGG